MDNGFGSDYLTICDEDGTEHDLEILSELIYNGETYLAVLPADEEMSDLHVSILKSVEEDGEPILCPISDQEELEAVYSLMMDSLFSEAEEEE